MKNPVTQRAVLVVLVGLLGAGAASADASGFSYSLGACSRVVRDACGDCEPGSAEPLMGGFTVVADPVRIDGADVATHLVRDIVLRSEHGEAHGLGMLIVAGGHASLLAMLDLGEGEVLVGGSGSATGRFPHAIHLDHLVVGEMRFEIYATPAIFADEDGDAVTDADDLCPGTVCGAVVGATGCAVDQLCPCLTRPDGSPWASHRQYVRCVLTASRSLLLAGRLDSRSRASLVRSAARSDCGRSVLALLDRTLAGCSP